MNKTLITRCLFALTCVASVIVAARLVERTPGVPANVRELLSEHPLWGPLGLLGGALLLTTIPWALVQLWESRRHWNFLFSLLVTLVGGSLAFALIHSVVPIESIDDIVGTPVLELGDSAERLVRFLGLVLGMVWSLGLGIYLSRRLVKADPGLAVVLPMALLAIVASYCVVVLLACTDNVVELLAVEGRSWKVFGLPAWLILTGSMLGHLLPIQSVSQQRRTTWHWLFGVAWMVAGTAVAWLLIKLATAASITKYGATFSALQFLLSPGRHDYLPESALLPRFLGLQVLLMLALTAGWFVFRWLLDSMGVTGTSEERASVASPKVATRASNEGVDVAIDRRIQAWAAAVVVAWLLLLLLGSWYPFEYRDYLWEDAWRRWWGTGTTGGRATSDVAINFIAAMPLGFLGVFAIRGNQGPIVWRVIATLSLVAVVAGWSVLLEVGQNWVEGRVASRGDTVAQISGSLLAALLAVGCGNWFSNRVAVILRGTSRLSPSAALLDLYAAGYVGWMLLPFVPAVSPSELKAKWKSGAIELSPLAAWSEDPWQAAYTLVVAAVTALPIGWWMASRFATRRLPIGWLTAALAAMLSVVLLEICQVFIQTRTAAADDAIWSCVGAFGGAVAYQRWQLVAHRQGLEDASRARPAETSAAAGIIAVLYAIALLLVAWAPFDLIDSSEELNQRITRLTGSTEGHWLAGNDLNHATNLLRAFLWATPLGCLLGVAATCSRQWTLMSWGLAIGFGTLVCFGAEAGQLFSRQHTPSLAGFGTRMAGCGFGLALAFYMARILIVRPRLHPRNRH